MANYSFLNIYVAIHELHQATIQPLNYRRNGCVVQVK
jgi:hypothetical protein